jgi:hypothetical protein
MGNNLPVVDLGTDRTAIAIAAGSTHTCAVLDNGVIRCWGEGDDGRLGTGGTEDRGDGPGEMGVNLPTANVGAGLTATTITAGLAHTCALLGNGSVKCWGDNFSGQLGYGDRNDRGDDTGEMGANLLAVDFGSGRTATAVTAGSAHTCALLDNASIKCWGDGANGRLGTGDTDPRGNGPNEMGANLPAVDLGPGRRALAVTAGTFHTCALLDNGAMKCWGNGFSGQLGTGNTDDLGDNPGELGADLSEIDLVRPIGRASLTVGLRADRSTAIDRTRITYTVTLRNTGSTVLTGIEVETSIEACRRTLTAITPRSTSTYTCTHTATTGQAVNYAFVSTIQGALAISPVVRTRVDPRVIRADGLIRAGSGALAGGNTYNTTGASQTATATTTALTPVRFTWRIQNDGNANDRFRLRGTAGTNRFTVTYRRGTTNITTAVRAGTFTTPNLTPGATTDVTVTVTPTRRARTGDTLTTTLTARSTASSSATDTVRTTTTRR